MYVARTYGKMAAFRQHLTNLGHIDGSKQGQNANKNGSTDSIKSPFDLAIHGQISIMTLSVRQMNNDSCSAL